MSAAAIVAAAFVFTSCDSETEAYTDFAVLSTSDVHGKCWEEDLLNDTHVTRNMLRISTFVKEIREQYGEENVLLIDNGDAFQGNIVSEAQLLACEAGVSDLPPAMEVCFEEIGYDVFVLGNHEFNHAWDCMNSIYQRMEDNGISVLAANLVYAEDEDGHSAGENVVKPYTIKTVTVNGHEHRIGILGIENTDCERWGVEDYYPGMIFAHPENSNGDVVYEAEQYIPQMKAEGCEFIIVSYHAGLGSYQDELDYWINTEDQGMRLIKNSHDIDLLILGHDHTTGYSNSFYENADGESICVVNAGGSTVTRSILRFTENEDGTLSYELREHDNVDPTDYEVDTDLEEKMTPYADMAEQFIAEPAGTLSGDWDGNNVFYCEQTDTMDLISASMMYALDSDMAVNNVIVASGFTASEGDVSIKDVYRFSSFSNFAVAIRMTGREIKEVVEENAASHFSTRVINGQPYFYPKGDIYTLLIFGGINFTCDMSRPEGDRIQIEGFSNGKRFNENETYDVVVNDYSLNNNQGAFSVIDTDGEDSEAPLITECIGLYLSDMTERNGSVTPDDFDWHWSIVYTEPLPPYDGPVAAEYADHVEEGHRYIIVNEAASSTMSAEDNSTGIANIDVDLYGNFVIGDLPEKVRVFTVHRADDGRLLFVDKDGRYLTSDGISGLILTDSEGEDGASCWELKETYGGYLVTNSAYGSGDTVNFYEVR